MVKKISRRKYCSKQIRNRRLISYKKRVRSKSIKRRRNRRSRSQRMRGGAGVVPLPIPLPIPLTYCNEPCELIVPIGEGLSFKVCNTRNKLIRNKLADIPKAANILSRPFTIYDYDITYTNVIISRTTASRLSVYWLYKVEDEKDQWEGNLVSFTIDHHQINNVPPQLTINEFFFNGKNVDDWVPQPRPPKKRRTESTHDADPDIFNNLLKENYTQNPPSSCVCREGTPNPPSSCVCGEGDWSASLLGMNLIYYFVKKFNVEPDNVGGEDTHVGESYYSSWGFKYLER
jgi:hypothetical protein